MFKPSILVSTDGMILAIKYIESVEASRDEADVIVDKLADDIVFAVIMVSGKAYTISTKYQMEIFKKQGTPLTVKDTHEEILEKWVYIVSNAAATS